MVNFDLAERHSMQIERKNNFLRKTCYKLKDPSFVQQYDNKHNAAIRARYFIKFPALPLRNMTDACKHSSNGFMGARIEAEPSPRTNDL